jgi:hypothetical protein
MVRSGFNFDIWFVFYRFFKFQKTLDEHDIITFDFFTCMQFTHPHCISPALEHLHAAPFFPRYAGSFSDTLFFFRWSNT